MHQIITYASAYNPSAIVTTLDLVLLIQILLVIAVEKPAAMGDEIVPISTNSPTYTGPSIHWHLESGRNIERSGHS